MADYSKLPAGVKLQVKPFKAHVDEQKLQDFETLLKLSPVAPANFENSDKSVERRYGVPRDWILNAKDHWLNKFDWRKHEDHINSFPNYTAQVKDDVGYDLDIHFVALFSEKQDAIPIALYHGWPGSFLEFLQILELLKSKYSPKDLPYHVIVPSIPGYAYSSGPPLDYDYSIEDAADALNNLMVGLGFGSGYIAQGGDLGSFVSRHQAATKDSCKGMHLNFSPIPRPKNADDLPMEKIEQTSIGRGIWFREVGAAYSLEHGTRTATIGHCLSASPVALLSWIGEKFLEWTDEDPSLDHILESVTLYWMTDTFPRCIYPYRGVTSGRGRERPYVEKPSGYSFFPKELVPMPKSWVATSCNLVSASVHETGGHFAAMEKPKELLADIEEYVQKAWKGQENSKL
ncbi:epoxide hydrolase [Lecanosticta acicola]|uniref:Epoxide hydrolase n=1 Tax=Lecanosticta acicola TaxID=111012 RepID=A0AAI8Z794_9PEZI|nr:epoxide hydrolase [Lecanosticta acicola]